MNEILLAVIISATVGSLLGYALMKIRKFEEWFLKDRSNTNESNTIKG